MNDLMMVSEFKTIGDRVRATLKGTNITVPRNYNVDNSLAAAMLLLSEPRKGKGYDGRPLYQTVTKASIHSALLRMVVQGLSPIMDQCYLIPYKNKLMMQRGYLGSIMVAKRVDKDVFTVRAECVYEGDTFEFDITNGLKTITKHQQTLDTIGSKIKGAYAIVVDHKNQPMHCEIMNWNEIITAWKMSGYKDIDAKGNLDPTTSRAKFPQEYCKKTVINRVCKKVIKTSTDINLSDAAAASDEETGLDYVIETEKTEMANTVEVEFETVCEQPTAADPEQVPVANQDQEMISTNEMKMMVDLSGQLKKDDSLIEQASKFTGRTVQHLRELSMVEGQSFIKSLSDEVKAAGSETDEPKKPSIDTDDMPDW